MSKIIEQLKEALRQETILYQAILDLSEQKTRLVIENQVRELEKLTEKEQQFIREMSRFEQIRQSLLQHFALEKELEEAPQNLSALLLFLQKNQQEDIAALRDKLVDLVQQISEKNQLNEALIQQSLDFIKLNIELLTQDERSTTPYDRKADESKKQQKQLFDAKF